MVEEMSGLETVDTPVNVKGEDSSLSSPSTEYSRPTKGR